MLPFVANGRPIKGLVKMGFKLARWARAAGGYFPGGLGRAGFTDKRRLIGLAASIG